MEQLPTPSMFRNHNHAYVSLTSIIDHFLAFGFEPDLNNTSNTISALRAITNYYIARQMYNNISLDNSLEMSIMILFLTFWSDNFEATALRKNTHSTWIKTVAICPPPSNMTSTPYNYLVAIGRKNDNHDKNNSIFNYELQQLEKVQYRYYGKLKKNLPVIVKVLAMSADRPERSSMNHVIMV